MAAAVGGNRGKNLQVPPPKLSIAEAVGQSIGERLLYPGETLGGLTDGVGGDDGCRRLTQKAASHPVRDAAKTSAADTYVHAHAVSAQGVIHAHAGIGRGQPPTAAGAARSVHDGVVIESGLPAAT